jgi:hypothetical protein
MERWEKGRGAEKREKKKSKVNEDREERKALEREKTAVIDK